MHIIVIGLFLQNLADFTHHHRCPMLSVLVSSEFFTRVYSDTFLFFFFFSPLPLPPLFRSTLVVSTASGSVVGKADLIGLQPIIEPSSIPSYD
jgi:hypothetical protein